MKIEHGISPPRQKRRPNEAQRIIIQSLLRSVVVAFRDPGWRRIMPDELVLSPWTRASFPRSIEKETASCVKHRMKEKITAPVIVPRRPQGIRTTVFSFIHASLATLGSCTAFVCIVMILFSAARLGRLSTKPTNSPSDTRRSAIILTRPKV
jgi:hypothetical protein